MPDQPDQHALQARYNAVRAQVPGAAALVLLHIGAEHTGVAVGSDAQPSAMLTLAIGSGITARAHFKHQPPSPLELENAIVTVEDEVTRARQLIAPAARLYTTDVGIRDIARRSGVTDAEQMQLSLEAMERTFDRLAQLSLGRPVSSEVLPKTNDFAASLLILREFMHHLQFADITILSQPGCTAARTCATSIPNESANASTD